jgi:protein arginine kinase
MIDLSLLTDGGVGWLDASGPASHLVLSTRIRLARNLAGHVFQGRNSETEREEILSAVEGAARESVLLRRATRFRLDRLDRVDRQLLHERHLVSKELAGLDANHPVKAGSAVFLGDGLGVMINEEDHLRLQSIRSGFALPEAYERAAVLDRELGSRVPYAYHQEFGYLTACPTNTGTGMRASVLIHLPGLVLTKEIQRVLTGLQQMGLTYRGLYGEGSEVVGNFFQISNQTTLGRSEDELIDQLVHVVRRVIEKEEEARRVLQRDAGYIIEDKLWRAYGTLRFARSLTFDEAMNYLSGVRLAVGLKLISGLSVYTLNKLLVFSQPAHLSYVEGRTLNESEAAQARARYVRDALASEAGSNG